MKLLIATIALLGATAHAAPQVIFQESKTVHITDPNGANLICVAGRANDGHHFPGPTSPSRLEMRSIHQLLISANTETAVLIDPSGQIGNHCTELMQQVNAAVPGDLVIQRTVSSITDIRDGRCVHRLIENLDATLGTLKLGGTAEFTAEVMPKTDCFF